MAKAAQNNQLEQAFAPFMAYNTLVMEATEKVVAMQIATFQKLSKVGFDNAKAAFDIKSAEELKTYADKQQAIAKNVTEIVTEDARNLGELNKQLLDNSRKLVEKNVKAASAKAA